MKILQGIAWALLGIITLDALGFIAWAFSGQYPADGCYLGTITAHILRAIL